MHQTITTDPGLIDEASEPGCNHRKSGVIIRDDAGRYLILDPTDYATGLPAGVLAGAGCLSGHIDQHGDGAWSARALAGDQLDANLTGMVLVATGWRPDRCWHTPSPGQPGYDPHRVGHQWEIYQAQLTSDLSADIQRAGYARWLTAAQLHPLAIRTSQYALGEINPADYDVEPGLEPVWALWLARLGVIHLSTGELEAIHDLMAEGRPMLPARWWPAREHLAHLDDQTNTELTGELDAVRADLARVDHKAALLLTFTGGSFSVLAALTVLAGDLALPARAALAVAVVLLIAATALTLRTIRPVLAAPTTNAFGPLLTGFIDHATATTPEELLERLGRDPEERRVREIWCLSQIATVKYRRLALALNLTLAGLAVVIAAVVLAVLHIGA